MLTSKAFRIQLIKALIAQKGYICNNERSAFA